MENTAYIVVIVILAILTVSFLIWALVVQQQVESRDVNLIQNPYAIRIACTNGTQPHAYEIPLENDPQKTGYQTINYCTVNAPPSQFYAVVRQCPAGNTDFSTQLKKFIDWYPIKYTPACGNNWKNITVPVSNQTLPEVDYELEPPVDVNNTTAFGLNGAYDPIAWSTIECAGRLGFTEADTPGLALMKEQTGSA